MNWAEDSANGYKVPKQDYADRIVVRGLADTLPDVCVTPGSDMPSSSRHNFPSQVRRALAIRAAHFCSNPQCLKLTAGPASDGKRGLETGHGAHICAAAPGGPRYDTNQTKEERRGVDNGLWLCRECGDIIDKDGDGHSSAELRAWKTNHEAMIAEVRTQGWARSIELLRSGRANPALAEQIIALFEDRRVFWAAFDAELTARVRHSLDGLRRELTHLRRRCVASSPLDVVIVALGRTIRNFYDTVEPFDMDTLRCDSGDAKWRAFASALKVLRKAIGYQLAELARSYDIQLQGEFAAYQRSLQIQRSTRD